MALDPFITEQINAVVKEWIGEGRMFTAFEVSLAIKERGVRERHRNLRDGVHEIIFQHGTPASYSRTLMDVGAPEQAWVYHPMSGNPYFYRPLDRSGTRDAATAPPDVDPTIVPRGVRNPISLVWDSIHSPTVPAGAYGTDQRGRLCVPATLLTQLGAGPGQRLKIQCEPSSERLIATKASDTERVTPDSEYTVEADGNVRLTQETLDKAGIGSLQCYRIEGDGNSVTVRKFG